MKTLGEIFTAIVMGVGAILAIIINYGAIALGIVLIFFIFSQCTGAFAQCQYDPYCSGWQRETQRQRESDWRMQQNDQWRNDYWQRERQYNDSIRQPSPYSNDPYYDRYNRW